MTWRGFPNQINNFFSSYCYFILSETDIPVTELMTVHRHIKSTSGKAEENIYGHSLLLKMVADRLGDIAQYYRFYSTHAAETSPTILSFLASTICDSPSGE